MSTDDPRITMIHDDVKQFREDLIDAMSHLGPRVHDSTDVARVLRPWRVTSTSPLVLERVR